MNLGFVAERFESADRGPGTISSANSGDPGGKSYGVFQLSAATLVKYLKESFFKFKNSPFIEAFDKEWRATASSFPEEFELDQSLFITKNLYLPNITLAKTLGYPTGSRKIQEAVFSIAVQHQRAALLIKRAFVPRASVNDLVKSLYNVRLSYVLGLSLASHIEKALKNRYKTELKVVLSIEE